MGAAGIHANKADIPKTPEASCNFSSKGHYSLKCYSFNISLLGKMRIALEDFSTANFQLPGSISFSLPLHMVLCIGCYAPSSCLSFPGIFSKSGLKKSGINYTHNTQTQRRERQPANDIVCRGSGKPIRVSSWAALKRTGSIDSLRKHLHKSNCHCSRSLTSAIHVNHLLATSKKWCFEWSCVYTIWSSRQ